MEVLITGANGFLRYYRRRNYGPQPPQVVATGKGPPPGFLCIRSGIQLPRNGFHGSLRFMMCLHPFGRVLSPCGAIKGGTTANNSGWPMRAQYHGHLPSSIMPKNCDDSSSMFPFRFFLTEKGGMYRKKITGSRQLLWPRKLEAEEIREYPGDWSIV